MNLHKGLKEVLLSHLGQLHFLAGQVLLKLINPMGKSLSKYSSS